MTVATAAVVLGETIPPAVIGVVFLGDQTRPGLAAVAWVGFFIAVASAVMLARFGEAHHRKMSRWPTRWHVGKQMRRPAAAELLSWWPVDLQLFLAIPETTEVHSGRIITSFTACSNPASFRARAPA